MNGTKWDKEIERIVKRVREAETAAGLSFDAARDKCLREGLLTNCQQDIPMMELIHEKVA